MSLGIGLGLSRASRAAIAPASGSKVWLPAASPTAYSLNGSLVTAFADKSGNANNATQATPANQPTYSATGGPNGTTASVYAGAQELVGAALPTGNRNWTVFIVQKVTLTGTSARTCVIGGSYGAQYTSTGPVRELILVAVQDDMADTITNAWEAWTLQDNGTNQIMRVNGVAKTLSASTSVPKAVAGGYVIGSGGALSLPMTGSLAELIVYDRVLSAAEIAQTEQYIRNWSLIW